MPTGRTEAPLLQARPGRRNLNRCLPRGLPLALPLPCTTGFEQAQAMARFIGRCTVAGGHQVEAG